MAEAINDKAVIEFKGRMLMVTVLRLHTTDPELVTQQLNAHLSDSNDWVRAMPLVLDVSEAGDNIEGALPTLISGLKELSLNLLGLAGFQPEDDSTQTQGLPHIHLGSKRQRTPQSPQEPATTAAPQQAAAPKPTLTLDKPVRSGQRIYSEGDLIITSSVGEGAEAIAAGNIHIYGNLRGRALAGAPDNESARIYCQRLNAELVAVAGHYRVAENLPETSRQEAVKIGFDGENLSFTPLL